MAMSGADHYKRAEELLSHVEPEGTLEEFWGTRQMQETPLQVLMIALTHAVLALTTATAHPAPREPRWDADKFGYRSD